MLAVCGQRLSEIVRPGSRSGVEGGITWRGLFKHLVHVVSALWTQAPAGVCPVP